MNGFTTVQMTSHMINPADTGLVPGVTCTDNDRKQ